MRGSNTTFQMFCFNQEQSQRRVLLIEEILQKVCVLMGMIEREKIGCARRNKIKEGEEALRRLRWWDSKHKEEGYVISVLVTCGHQCLAQPLMHGRGLINEH